MWTTIDKLTNVDWDHECLSLLRNPAGQTSIVRKTKDGQFAVLALNGKRVKLLKVLPTLDRARAYNFAVAR